MEKALTLPCPPLAPFLIMKQTLLAFLAMSLFTLLSVNQQQAALRYHGSIHSRDVEMAALDLAMQQLASIRTRAFDEADMGAGTPRRTTDGLSGNIGQEHGTQDFNDIDDFSGLVDTLDHAFNGSDYAFRIAVQVQNVSPVDPTTIVFGPSLAKEVTVNVSEPTPPANRPPVIVSLSRTLTAQELFYH